MGRTLGTCWEKSTSDATPRPRRSRTYSTIPASSRPPARVWRRTSPLATSTRNRPRVAPGRGGFDRRGKRFRDCIILVLLPLIHPWRLDADLRIQVRERARLRRDAKDVRRPFGGMHRVRYLGQEGTPTGWHLLQRLGLLLDRLQQQKGSEGGAEEGRHQR